jgi:hypothetical protein
MNTRVHAIVAALALTMFCRAGLAEGRLTVHFLDAVEAERTYRVPRIPDGQAVRIDGKLDDQFWETSPRIEDFENQVGTQGKTTLQLGYDRQSLYLAVRCETADPAQLVSRSPAGARDEPVWGGHCIDLKVSALGRAFQFLVAPNGAWMDMENKNAAWNAPGEVRTSVEDAAYLVEMRLEYAAFDFPEDADGRTLKITLGRASPDKQLQTLSRPYGNVEKAPTFVLGVAAERDKGGFMSRGTSLTWHTDREVYTSAIRQGAGRVRIVDHGGERLTGDGAIQFAVTDGQQDLIAERISPLESANFDYDVDLTALAPGAYTAEMRLMDGATVFHRIQKRLVIRASQVSRTGTIGLTVPACPASLPAWPVTFGVPFPEGALLSHENLALTDADGRGVPIQARVTSRWSREGPVRWVLIDAVIPMATTAQQLSLAYGPEVKRAAAADDVRVSASKMADGRAALRIDSSHVKAWVPRTHSPGVAGLQVTGVSRLQADAETGPYLVDEAGTVYYGNLDPEPEIVIEDAGPLKACVRVKGWHVSREGRRLGRFILTYRIFAGVPHLFMDHTFIITADSDKTRYRDIGYAVPNRSMGGIFGAPRLLPFTLGAADANAYLLQRDDLHGKVVIDGTFFEAFGRAEGWVSAGGLAVSVRDFWQNFPKEFEVTPNRLNVHFWPGHGEAPIRTGDRLNARNAYQCWFAHEGELLDFKAPAEVVELVKQDGPAGDNWGGLMKANAMGIAKTHQLLFQFHDGNWDRARVRSTHRVFDLQPTAIVAPEWVCASGVFGKIAPRRPERAPETERAIDGTISRFIRQQNTDRDYGMWNFGDAHHNWNWQKRRWRLYRTWRATHHSWPRWPWLQFVRSGSFETLQYARRNAYHVADISHCHYTDDTFRAAKYPTGKAVGGLCDYKGLVHWCAGNRSGYNSVADVLLHHHYLTGDLRARDTALAHGRLLLEEDQSHSGRSGSARLMSLVALYQHTWDNGYLRLIDMHVDELLRTTREEDVFADEWAANQALKAIWTPGFMRYLDLSGSERARTFITRWADYLTRFGKDAMFGHQRVMESPLAAILGHLSYAWLITGEDRYLGAAAFRNRHHADAYYTGEDASFHGAPIGAKRNMPLSFWMTDVGAYLAALEEAGGALPDWRPPAEPKITSLWRETTNGEKRHVFYARIRQRTEGPFQIRLFVSARDHVAELSPLDGRGRTLRTEGVRNTRFKSMESVTLDVPADDCLEYVFKLQSKKGYAYIPLPVATGQEGLKEVYPVTVNGATVYIQGTEPFYFDLPEQAETFLLSYSGEYGNRLTVSNGQQQVVFDETTIRESGPMRVRLNTAGSRRGWSLRYLGELGHGRCGINLSVLEPEAAQRAMWLAIHPDKFFWPAEAGH